MSADERDAVKRMMALDEERIRMVKEHKSPVLIQAISEAYLRERKRTGIDSRK